MLWMESEKSLKECNLRHNLRLTVTPEEIKFLSDSTVQKGNFLMMLKQIDDALKAYSRAIELSPNNTAAFNNRGVAYHGKGKLDLAVKDYNIAIKLNPDDANAYSNRGTVYLV